MDQLDEKERARQTNPADPDNLLVWSVISAGCFYREGMRPLKLAYNKDLEAAIKAGRVAEREEIIAELEFRIGEARESYRLPGLEAARELVQNRRLAGKAGAE